MPVPVAADATGCFGFVWLTKEIPLPLRGHVVVGSQCAFGKNLDNLLSLERAYNPFIVPV